MPCLLAQPAMECWLTCLQAAARTPLLPCCRALLHHVQLHAGVSRGGGQPAAPQSAALQRPTQRGQPRSAPVAHTRWAGQLQLLTLLIGPATQPHPIPTLPPLPSRYHVHEKAILMVTVPLGLLAVAGLMPRGAAAVGDFFFLNTGGEVFGAEEVCFQAFVGICW